MDHLCICWGHNPGQRFVKDSITVGGKRKDLRPYPATIAPWAKSDDTGLARRTKDLTATIGSALYIGGDAAERLPLAMRQQSSGRLDLSSPIYGALAQMSAQHAGLTGRTNGSRLHALIATALPVAWRLDDAGAEQALRAHIRRALGESLIIDALFVQSEPNAVVGCELLDDDGNTRKDQAELATGLVCVGDLGGGTLNRSVLDKLRALPGQAASPALGSSEAVKDLAQRSGVQYLDAERRLETAVRTPGKDSLADALLRQYREAVVSELQQAMTRSTVKISLLPSVAFEQRQNLPALPALYFVLNPHHEIVYIGETGDLRARWAGKNHQRTAQMRDGGYRIHWMDADADAATRKTAEGQAIAYFRPLWNRTEVPADEMKEILAYIRNVARHMGMDPRDLHQQILKEWAYNRARDFSRE